GVGLRDGGKSAGRGGRRVEAAGEASGRVAGDGGGDIPLPDAGDQLRRAAGAGARHHDADDLDRARARAGETANGIRDGDLARAADSAYGDSSGGRQSRQRDDGELAARPEVRPADWRRGAAADRHGGADPDVRADAISG